ncbi:MAG: 16S rRNA (cytosine(1402)-N(4))-methyltransferase, partial [Parcubacteria group bacterium RIFCSPHIGHO2_01_FULL_45_26]
MHVPVLKQEVLEYLDPKPNENFVDATLGFGGHTEAILEKTGPRGKVLGIEWDPEAISRISKQERLILVNDSYSHLEEIVKREKFPKISGILFDLGMSSSQLEESKRGFSFQKNEVLDMRFNPEHGLDAKKILNFWSRFDIQGILKDYGEEQFAESIARHIVEARKRSPIVRTFQLVEVIKAATPKWYHRKKLHPATKTFQALRIASNNELENLKAVLPQAVSLL